MTTRVTQCPKCRTSFRVTEAQLSVANGAVRCGSCLHIFQAPEHWLDDGVTAAPAAVSRPEAAPLSSPSSPSPSPAQAPPDDAAEDDIASDDWLSGSYDTVIDDSAVIDDNSEAFDPPASDNGWAPQGSTTEGDHNPTADPDSLDGIFDSDIFSDEDLQMLAEDFELDEGQPVGPSESRQPLMPEPEPESGSDSAPFSGSVSDSDSDSDSGTDDAPFDFSSVFDDDEDDMLINDTQSFELDSDPEGVPDDTDSTEQDARDDERFADDPAEDDDFSDTFLGLDEPEREPRNTGFKDLDDIGEDEQEEDWTRKLLDDDEDDESAATDADPGRVTASPEEPEAEPEPEDQFENLLDYLQDDDDQASEVAVDQDLLDILDTAEDEYPEDEFSLGQEPLLAGDRIGEEKRALLANIEPEPVEFAAASAGQSWQRWAWRGGAVAAALLLLVQYVVFNFASLARDEGTRPVLGGFCSVLGCQLPEQYDMALIRSSNLVVRSHPEQAGALVVDAIIANRATFRQPFPDMELQFTDLDGQPVAGRRFRPGEYLSGELSGASMMPVRQPVHISLELVDPGEAAVSYRLLFHPPRAG